MPMFAFQSWRNSPPDIGGIFSDETPFCSGPRNDGQSAWTGLENKPLTANAARRSGRFMTQNYERGPAESNGGQVISNQ